MRKHLRPLAMGAEWARARFNWEMALITMVCVVGWIALCRPPPRLVSLWDFRIYQIAVDLFDRGLDPYDLTLIKNVTHIPIGFLYSPAVLHLFDWVGALITTRIAIPLYGAGMIAAALVTVIVQTKVYLPSFRYRLMAAAFVFVVFDGAGYETVKTGNIAMLAYAAVFIAIAASLRSGRWTGFYAVIAIFAQIKLHSLLWMAFPILISPREAPKAIAWSLVALIGVAANYVFWPDQTMVAFASVKDQIRTSGIWGRSAFGVIDQIGRLLPSSVAAYAKTPGVMGAAQLLAEGVVLAVLAGLFPRVNRRYRAGAMSRRRYLSWITIAVIVVNPRVMIYDVPFGTIPLLALFVDDFIGETPPVAAMAILANLLCISTAYSVHHHGLIVTFAPYFTFLSVLIGVAFEDWCRPLARGGRGTDDAQRSGPDGLSARNLKPFRNEK